MPEEVAPPNTQQVADLPEWARTYISDLRSEAASNRVKASEATARETAANEKVVKLNDEVAGAKTAADTANQQVLRINAALKAGVSADKVQEIAKRLTGNTEQELIDDAKALVAAFGGGSEEPAPYVDPSQGRGSAGGAPNTNLSPGAAAFRQLVEGHYLNKNG